MKIILQEDIKNLGRSGDVVTVKDGFARNYLIPKNLAIRATTKNVKVLSHQKKLIDARIAKRKKTFESLKEALEGRSITVPMAVGKDEKLYGSVTARDIEHALLEDNIKVDKKLILLKENIKTLGVYPVHIALGDGEEVEIKVWVVAK
ncbi:MAG: 50S ribosomal protein L9 [Pseudomonadota bacterium]